MLTPQKIQDLADPIESIYINMVEELLRNIGRHVTKPNWTHTAVWEVQKLSELGQLTQENAAIINKWIKSMPAELRETMEATRAAALDKLEKELERAAQAGHITPAITDSTVEVLQNYLHQAADRLNLVNTTMLQSSLDQYARAVQLTADIERRAERTQELLNEAAANVATSVETRQQALNRAIKQIAAEGLTGFIDKAGRHWTPEAYVNMDIRTTVHNVAIQSTRARMEDYNTQVIQISSHAGARPLCYPYQGKFYSWNNTSGLIALGNGKMVDFAPLNSTSYGQAAGIFGINCGHYPIPVIPGVSIPHGADFIQPKEKNDKLYAESQEQRALERKIRAAKRVVDMAGSTATKADRQAVRAAQQQMREFIERTGRTRRYDREKIVKTGTKDLQTTTQKDKITSGAITGALNPDSKQALNHAKQYYESVRHMKTDVLKIARNTGYSEEEIEEIKRFVFFDKHDLGGAEPRRFDESYEMAQSWQRLIDGKNIQPHDLTMLEHEKMEQRLMGEGKAQAEAHIETSRLYNYAKEAAEFYDKTQQNQ